MARQKKHRENESKMSKKMLGLDKVEKRRESPWSGFLRSGLAIGAASAAIGAVVAVAARWKMWW